MALKQAWLLVVGVSLLCVWLFRDFAYHFPADHVGSALLGLGSLTLLLAILGMGEISRGAKLVLRGCAVVWAGFVLIHTPTFDPLVEVDTATWLMLYGLQILVPLCAIVGWFLPAFFVPVFLLPVWQHQLFEIASGLPILSTVDFMVLSELPLFLLVMLFIAEAVRRLMQFRSSTGVVFAPAQSKVLSDWLLLVAIGVHMGNYFYAGIAKLELAGWTTWILENPTPDIIFGSALHGAAPLALSLPLLEQVYRMSSALLVPLNLWVMVIQLGALLAFVHRRILVWLLIMFDVLHMGIFVLTGILFWKWIILNALCIVAVGPALEFPSSRIVRCVLTGIVVASTTLFSITWLGWFDSNANNVFQVKAQTKDGRLVTLPSNWFGAHSFNFAAPWLVQIEEPFFPTRTWGASTELEDFLIARRCSQRQGYVETTLVVDPALPKFLQRQQRFAAREFSEHRSYSYDLYPHHVWSMPSLFPDAMLLDPAEIDAFQLSMESVCVTLEEGRLIARPVARGELVVPVVSKDRNPGLAQ